MDPAFHIVWTWFSLKRDGILACHPLGVPRIFRMLDLIVHETLGTGPCTCFLSLWLSLGLSGMGSSKAGFVLRLLPLDAVGADSAFSERTFYA